MADDSKAQPAPALSLTRIPMLPPPAPSNPPSSTSSSSLRKRKRHKQSYPPRPLPLRRVSSNGSTAFSASTREQVKSLDNSNLCWHYSATLTDIYYIITKTDQEFKIYQIRGLINIDSPSYIDNGIPLYALCHRNFNNHYNPGFVFIPTNITYFRAYKERDIIRRQEHYNQHQTRVKRVCPSQDEYQQHQLVQNAINAEDHGGLYKRYTLRDYFPKLGCCERNRSIRIGQLFPPTSWHGDPSFDP